MVQPSAGVNSSKKQKISVADISHESMERIKSNMDRHTYTIRIRDVDFFNSERGLEESFKTVVTEVVDEILRDLDYDSAIMRVGINFTFNDGATRSNQYYVNIAWTDVAADNTVAEMMRRLEGSFQSGDKATFSKFKVVATVFRMAKGNGETSTPNIGKNTHILIPLNISFENGKIPKGHLKDGPIGCAFRAVVLYRKTVREGLKAKGIDSSTIKKAAKKLAESCGMEYTDPFIATDFEKIERNEKCRVIVFAPEGKNVKILYNPSNKDRNDPLYIIGYDGKDHYFAIAEDKLKLCFENTKKKEAYRNGIFCTYCYTFNSNNISHKLDCDHYGCRQCLNDKCQGSSGHNGHFIECKDCFREFYNKACFDNHIDNKTCKKIRNCQLCLTQIKMDRFEHFSHDCTKAYCKTCSTSYKPREDEYHICYMKKKKKKKEKKNKKKDNIPDTFTCYYDIETFQQEKGINNKGRKIIDMIPYLLVCQMICNLCTNKEGENVCRHCGARTRVFKLEADKGPTDKFIDFLMNFSKNKSKSKVVVAAHNGGKFDHQYVYASLLTHPNTNAISNDPIKRGNKIIYMGSNGNIVYRDTLLFTPCALKNMPKCMGITDQGVSKGFFPYTFLNEDRLNYKGPIPRKDFFETKKMSADEKQEFEEYYTRFQDKEYNIFEECKKYCTTDVNVLRRCFEKFRANFIKAFDIDCLADCPTIASLCFTIYKNAFMPEKKITILSRENCKHFTYEAIKWIIYQEKLNNTNIRHARNGGEKGFKIKNSWLYPDGFGYVNGVKTAFLYHGCAWHGHRGCDNGKGTLYKISSEDRYNITMKKEQLYKEAGFNVVRIWDCEWKIQKSLTIQDPDHIDKDITIGAYANRISNDAVNKRLVIDDSLFGGRTEPFVYYYPPTEGKKIIYLDYTSLYPFVQKRMKYPCGPPEKLVGDKVPNIETFKNGLNNEYFGVSFIKILPPQDLDIPVLPVRIEKKLIFPLCFTCAKDNCQKCTHNENERSIKGVFATPEIQLALNMGYKLLKIFEVWSFKEMEYLFEDYVNYFLKIKTEASGLPNEIHEEDPDYVEKLKEFVRLFKQKEGVELDANNIKKNPGMRFIAKLCLNSLWGKFAQNTPVREDKICTSDKEVWELINQCDIDVLQVIPIGAKYVVTTSKNNLSERSSMATNIPIASFTTAYARIKLYELLNKVKHRALYCDTDSCVFVAGENDEVPETGNFLGELTDELSDYGKGSYGESFVCTGPKSYAVKIRMKDGNVQHIVKAKGLTINEETRDIINFEKLLELALEKCSEKDTSHYESLYDDIKDSDVTVKAMNKMQIENVDDDDTELPHKEPSRISESSNHNASLNRSGRERTVYNVPHKVFQPGKLGGVSLVTGTKVMKFTSNKRVSVKNSCRTVPFGFKGHILPL